MKDRILKVLRKHKVTEYIRVYKRGTANYETKEITRDGQSHEWNYYKWGKELIIHHNYRTDKIIVFVNNKGYKE